MSIAWKENSFKTWSEALKYKTKPEAEEMHKEMHKERTEG